MKSVIETLQEVRKKFHERYLQVFRNASGKIVEKLIRNFGKIQKRFLGNF